jgi:uncharacterized protein (DUF849 family)
MAVFLGGNIRVGMADNRYLAHEDPVVHNEQLVRRVAEVVSHSERSLADYATTSSQLAPEKRAVESS